MTKNNANGQKAVPAKLADLKDVKHPSGANTTNQPANVNPANGNKAQPVQTGM